MASKKNFIGGNDLKIAVIGDVDTVAGFVLAGVGSRTGQGVTNFHVIDSKMRKSDVEAIFKETAERKDIGVIMINQHIADDIRHLVDLHTAVIPTILEVPSKDHPYDPNKDSIMQRVKAYFGSNI
eukprot:GHVL01039417.1.p1 GENE.GHVL01039417.1~~GHVL01039417.1.p1  ORF type:complete len:125 (+),score=22.18 GHVL01039417.1:62-436(+)